LTLIVKHSLMEPLIEHSDDLFINSTNLSKLKKIDLQLDWFNCFRFPRSHQDFKHDSRENISKFNQIRLNLRHWVMKMFPVKKTIRIVKLFVSERVDGVKL
jgi:hypothetical protein